MAHKDKTTIPDADKAIVAMVVYDGRLIIATSLRVYRRVTGGKFEAMKFVVTENTGMKP